MKRLINEIVKASKGFMKKEKIREQLQKMIVIAVKNGDINDDKSLKEMFETIDMATGALKQVPFDVYKKLASK